MSGATSLDELRALEREASGATEPARQGRAVASLKCLPRPRTVRTLRGATTLDVDDEPHMVERASTLLTEMLDRNQVDHDDLVSIVFTATDDIHSAFPALAARRMGLGDVPLLCARELEIDGATPRCVRALMHLMTSRSRSEMRHVYLDSGAFRGGTTCRNDDGRSGQRQLLARARSGRGYGANRWISGSRCGASGGT
ncbi:MAG: chorismate mutase [Microthrixaceae bacterium]